jgi:GT2 family glycosyltransferase
MPRVSVIVANYNGQRLLQPCLESLRRQTYRDCEVIMVDDASRDDSVAWTRAHFPEVRLLVLAHNSGLAVACNRGVEVAQGDILVLLNNDTEAEEGWLAALVSALDRHPRAGAVASKMLLYDRRDTLHTAGDMMGQDGIPRNRGVWELDKGQYDGQTTVFGACGGAAAYRRVAWQALGGFDEGLFMYLEDVDLAWRLQLAGWDVVFAPEARLYHHLSATGGGTLASYYTGRNTIWVIAKNWPAALWRQHWRRIVGAQGRIALDALKAWRGAEARARLKGQLAGLWGLPRWFAKRRTAPTPRAPLERLERLLLPV